MSKKVKELELNDLRRTLKGVKDLVLLEPLKLDSAADYELRRGLRAKKIRVKMVKNSLVKKIFTENGVKADPGSGPTLVCWGGNSIKELSTAVEDMMKVLKPDAKSPEKLKEKTAVADGEPVTLKVATTLPTRLEAIGSVVAAILGPGSAIAGALTGPATSLAGILKAIEEKGGAGAAPASA